MHTEPTNTEIKMLIERQTALLEENNELLRKMRKAAKIGLWFQIVWYVFLIGLPFALYFYILEPYFEALGSSYEVFSAGMNEIPGWKQFHETLEALKSDN